MAKEQKSIKKNTIYNMLKTFSSTVFPLITFPYVSRVLNPVGIGQYNFSNTYINYFSLIASLGVTTYAIRECAAVRDDQERLDKVASQIFSTNICTMLVAYAALIISLVFFRKLDSYRNLIIIFSSNILFTIVGADWINSALEDFKYITLRTFAMQLISLICIFIFVRKPSDVMNYALITVLASGGANILNMFYRRRFCRMRFIKDMGWKRHMPPILLLFAMQLSQTIFVSLDITMIGLFRTDAEVGLYSTSSKIYNMVNQVVASICWVVMPQLSAAFRKKDYDKINEILQYAINFIIVVGTPCLVGLFFMAPQIVEIVGGKEYLNAAPSLMILTVALAFSFLAGFVGNIIFLPSGREKICLFNCVLAAIVNFIANMLLIPKYGINAAAFTTALSQATSLFSALPFVEKEVDLGNIWDIIKAPLAGGVVLAICIFLVEKVISNFIIQLLAAILFGFIAYGAILVFLKNEFALNAIKSLKGRFIRR